MTATHAAQGIEQRPVQRFQSPYHGQQQVRLIFAEGHVFGRIVARLAQSTGVEEAHQRRVSRVVVQTCAARARAKAVADVGIRAASQRLHNGGLARLGSAEQPNHRYRLALSGLSQQRVQLALIDARVEQRGTQCRKAGAKGLQVVAPVGHLVSDHRERPL
jgi:hypothetical protein